MIDEICFLIHPDGTYRKIRPEKIKDVYKRSGQIYDVQLFRFFNIDFTILAPSPCDFDSLQIREKIARVVVQYLSKN